MFRLAYRQLVTEPLRSGLMALAVGAAISVILVLRAFETGLYIQSRTIVLERGAHLIVSQAGVANFIAARSSLPQLTRERIEAIDGVAAAHPVTGLPVIYEQNGKKTPIYLLVYDTLGGPRHVSSGPSVSDGHDVAIDIGLAKKHGLKPGDSLVISDFEFRVAGITTRSSALFMPFVFVSYDGLIDFFLESEIAPDISTFPLLSYLLVELAPDADPAAVDQAIETAVPEVDVMTPQKLASNDVQLGKDLFGPVIGLLITVAYVIGLLVVGLITYADVSSRRRSLGVLKALGFRLPHMVLGISVQSMMLLVVAFPVGMVLALAIGGLVERAAPIYLVPVLDPAGLIKTFVGMVLFTLLGGLLPLRLIARTDPNIAFRGG